MRTSNNKKRINIQSRISATTSCRNKLDKTYEKYLLG